MSIVGDIIEEMEVKPLEKRIEHALNIAIQFGGIDGSHHKDWVIDQMVRALTGCTMVEAQGIDSAGEPYTYKKQGESEEYKQLIADATAGEDGPDTYEWNKGIAP
jgi:hypothetical protein